MPTATVRHTRRPSTKTAKAQAAPTGTPKPTRAPSTPKKAPKPAKPPTAKAASSQPSSAHYGGRSRKRRVNKQFSKKETKRFRKICAKNIRQMQKRFRSAQKGGLPFPKLPVNEEGQTQQEHRLSTNTNTWYNCFVNRDAFDSATAEERQEKAKEAKIQAAKKQQEEKEQLAEKIRKRKQKEKEQLRKQQEKEQLRKQQEKEKLRTQKEQHAMKGETDVWRVNSPAHTRMVEAVQRVFEDDDDSFYTLFTIADAKKELNGKTIKELVQVLNTRREDNDYAYRGAAAELLVERAKATREDGAKNQQEIVKAGGIEALRNETGGFIFKRDIQHWAHQAIETFRNKKEYPILAKLLEEKTKKEDEFLDRVQRRFDAAEQQRLRDNEARDKAEYREEMEPELNEAVRKLYARDTDKSLSLHDLLNRSWEERESYRDQRERVEKEAQQKAEDQALMETHGASTIAEAQQKEKEKTDEKARQEAEVKQYFEKHPDELGTCMDAEDDLPEG